MGELRFPRESVIRTTAEFDATAEAELPMSASGEPRALWAYNQTRGNLLGVEVEVADFTPASLESRLPALTPQSGIALWIVPFRGISAANAHTPLDLLYLDSKNAVLDVVEFFPIGRVSASSRPASSVLALPADTIAATGICPGDQLILCPPEEMKRRFRDLSSVKTVDKGMRPSTFGADLLSPNAAIHLLQWTDLSRVESPSKAGVQVVLSSGPSIAALPSPAGSRALAPAKSWLRRLFTRGPRELRKVRREPISGIDAYFFTGGGPAAHGVRDISSHGIYIFTGERWYLGTVIRLTITDGREPAVRLSITANARVVRWGNDGVGLEFVLRGENDQRRGQVAFDEPTGNITRAMLQQFLNRVKTVKN